MLHVNFTMGMSTVRLFVCHVPSEAQRRYRTFEEIGPALWRDGTGCPESRTMNAVLILITMLSNVARLEIAVHR